MQQSGFGPILHSEQLAGGANNRVFRVETAQGNTALKIYFYHPDDPRDRLNAEYSFSRVAWDHGIREIPQPLAADRASRIGLYEYVHGRRATSEEIDDDAVEQAVAFFASLNAEKLRASATALPNASEACFSLAGHLKTVSRRIDRLAATAPAGPLDQEMLDFVQGELQPGWQRTEDAVRRGAISQRIGMEEEDLSSRAISPSDFGFHNALRGSDGRFRFIDFEYAGWDDLGRVVGDFFNQVMVPVPMKYYRRFADEVASLFPHPQRNRAKFDLLLPVYTMKWATIVLNEFLPAGNSRREFAAETVDAADARKRIQLKKARAAFARLDGVLYAADRG